MTGGKIVPKEGNKNSKPVTFFDLENDLEQIGMNRASFKYQRYMKVRPDGSTEISKSILIMM